MLATAFPANSGPPADLAGLADVAPLTHVRGVIGHTGPYQVAFPVLRVEVVIGGLDLPQVDRTDGAVDDGELVAATRSLSRSRAACHWWSCLDHRPSGRVRNRP